MLTLAGKKRNDLLQSPQNRRGWMWLIFGVAVVLGVVLAKNLMLGIGVFGGLVGLAVVFVCILNSEAGLYINIVYSFFSFSASRLFFQDNFPVGVVSNVLIIATFLGIFVKGRSGRT